MNLIDNLLAKADPKQEQRIHDRMMLSARIADALESKGWSQKELAAKLNKQPSEISKWLSGTHNFTIDTLSDLSQVLGVKLLCVKEEAPKEVEKLVTRTQYVSIMIMGQSQYGGAAPVSYNQFQRGIGQSPVPLRYDA